jgi:15-cis-phytoene synthase
MVHRDHYAIFRAGSKTYFYSSLFFPRDVREDVFILYSFVRKADDFVDAIPQQVGAFHTFKEHYHRAIQGEATGDLVVDSFARLAAEREIPAVWVDAFLRSMELDTIRNTYTSYDELDTYLYGSSEVIGLMMAKILRLPEESYDAARSLGKSMQFINFIRDIAEDLELGRTYFPQRELAACDLPSLAYEETIKRPENFREFIRRQVAHCDRWQEYGEKGYHLIPKRYLIPIKTASEMYSWTAAQIRADPFVVYTRKVKPSISRIVWRITCNSVAAGRMRVEERISHPLRMR